MGTPASFKPGQSGNPNGRPPKGYSITEMMRSILNEDPDLKREITMKVAQKAKEGDLVASKLLWQYMDGMPVQNIDLTTKDQPMNVSIDTKDE